MCVCVCVCARKVFQKLIKNHISSFRGDDINCHQYGFVNDKSTVSTISESVVTVHEYLMEKDNANIIYSDFSKGFDTVSHYRLLVKMKNFGIFLIVNIVKYFLTGRSMKVKIDNNQFETKYTLRCFLRERKLCYCF